MVWKDANQLTISLIITAEILSKIYDAKRNPATAGFLFTSTQYFLRQR
jgi:hypothetical protein